MGLSLGLAGFGVWTTGAERKSSRCNGKLTAEEAKTALIALIHNADDASFAHLAAFPLESCAPLVDQGQWKWASISLDLKNGRYSFYRPFPGTNNYGTRQCVHTFMQHALGGESSNGKTIAGLPYLPKEGNVAM